MVSSSTFLQLQQILGEQLCLLPFCLRTLFSSTLNPIQRARHLTTGVGTEDPHKKTLDAGEKKMNKKEHKQTWVSWCIPRSINSRDNSFRSMMVANSHMFIPVELVIANHPPWREPRDIHCSMVLLPAPEGPHKMVPGKDPDAVSSASWILNFQCLYWFQHAFPKCETWLFKEFFRNETISRPPFGFQIAPLGNLNHMATSNGKSSTHKDRSLGWITGVQTLIFQLIIMVSFQSWNM